MGVILGVRVFELISYNYFMFTYTAVLPALPPSPCFCYRALVPMMMSRPRVRTAKRLLPLGALREKHDVASSATARWRQSVVGPAVGGLQRIPLTVPTRDAVPLSTLDRHSSSPRYIVLFVCVWFGFGWLRVLTLTSEGQQGLG